MFEVDDTPVQNVRRGRPPGQTANAGITRQLAGLQVGQSFVAEGSSYPAAYNIVRQAKARKTSPLEGEFLVVKLDKGVRIGRTA